MIQFTKQVKTKKINHMIFKRLRQWGLSEVIYNGIITLNDSLKEKIKLKDKIYNFKEAAKPKNSHKNKKTPWLLNTLRDFLKEYKNLLMVLESKIFPIEKQKQGKRRPLDFRCPYQLLSKCFKYC